MKKILKVPAQVDVSFWRKILKVPLELYLSMQKDETKRALYRLLQGLEKDSGGAI